jgi:Sensors of blue-light using FAD
MPDLQHLCYTSTATRPIVPALLEGLLEQARSFNDAQAVTGVLLHHDGHFLQYLEGPPEGLARVYARIAASRLHAGLFTLLDGPIEERLFPDWRMGSTRVPAATVLSLRDASWRLLSNPNGEWPTLSPGLLLLRAHFSSLTQSGGERR